MNLFTLPRRSSEKELKGWFGGNVNKLPNGTKKRITTLLLLALKTLCLSLPDHRTFIEDYLKILDFIEWLKEYYPEKAKFLSKDKSF